MAILSSYDLSDGQSRYEKGVLTQVGAAKVYEVIGSYSHEGTDGKTYVVDYSSGVNGFKSTLTWFKISTPTLSQSARNVFKTAVV